MQCARPRRLGGLLGAEAATRGPRGGRPPHAHHGRLELAAQIRVHWPHCRCCSLSGFDAHVQELPTLPGPILAKPFDFDRLTAEVQQLLMHRQA